MIIVGLNAYHANVSAVLVSNGELLAAVEEERFNRIKHSAGFPASALQSCLDIAGVEPSQIDLLAISRDPRAHLWRKVWFALKARPSLDLIRPRLQNRAQVLNLPQRLAEALGQDESWTTKRIRYVEHHPAHLASTFFVSPFEDAAVCAIDGFGDFVSTSLARGRGSRIEVLERVYFPHSLGQLYLAITQFLGFGHFGDEFKVMGLAPYGAPDFVAEISQLLQMDEEGLFQLDLSFFKHWSSGDLMNFEDRVPQIGTVFTQKLDALLGPRRGSQDPLEPRHEAIAASLQVVFERAVFHILNRLHRLTASPSLCLAGGCAMNSVANGKVRYNTPFEQVFVQPAAADNGTALGAAYHVWNQLEGRPRDFVMTHSCWGSHFEPPQIFQVLEEHREQLQNCTITKVVDQEALCEMAVTSIARGEILGWFQGRMEWGARALGNRSILADPRRPDMRKIINSKIKFREKFRPFAPAILEESLDDYFVDARPDPFMLQVYPVRECRRQTIPAVTHVDGSGRLQTVHRETNPLFWKLIDTFRRKTGVPVLLNTSFNENEPICHLPAEALDCFLRTDMDALALGFYFLTKRKGLSEQEV